MAEEVFMALKMPALFIGHGNPMNAIMDNSYTAALKEAAKSIPRPKAILVVSAHWMAQGTHITCADRPRQIYDFYGFPDELYQVKYSPSGAEGFVALIEEELREEGVTCSDKWGMDHAAWAVLVHMYPNADIPVVEMSLDMGRDEEYHYNMGKKLRGLRDKGILVIGSGNIVHNLWKMNREMDAAPFAWTIDFDSYIARALENNDHRALIDYKNAGDSAKLAVPTRDHYLPLLYIAGMQEEGDTLEFIYTGLQHSSMSMRCIRIG